MGACAAPRGFTFPARTRMMRHLFRFATPPLVAALLSGASALPHPAAAQAPDSPSLSGVGGSSAFVERGRYTVIVDLDANRLHFTQGGKILWTARVGTGTGLRLKGEDREWHFATPTGTYQVQYKEENPDWIAPDWYFIENKKPIPPKGDPARRFPGGLGVAAVYIGNGLAIHGTDKPELLGQRVSHGCIRLSNRDAQRLFHNVQLGTEVVIVGNGRRKPTPDAAAPARTELSAELDSLSTDALVTRLEDDLWTDGDVETAWPEVASLLVRRGTQGEDDEALLGLLEGAGSAGFDARREYATFLADAYARGTLRTLGTLGRMGDASRERTARLIVEAKLGLYPGSAEDVIAPWPTKRVGRDALRRTAQRGWDALHAAEREFRETHAIGARYGGR